MNVPVSDMLNIIKDYINSDLKRKRLHGNRLLIYLVLIIMESQGTFSGPINYVYQMRETI